MSILTQRSPRTSRHATVRYWLSAASAWLIGASPAWALTHAAFDELLAQHVQQGQVDYPALKAKRPVLEAYLRQLASVDPAALSRKERLAFWINAYNAAALLQVLDARMPGSVKEIKGFFDKQTHALGGQMLTLNQVEERGRALGDWRLQFALTRAAQGSPPLRDEAYDPEWLDAQLAEQTRQHLADTAHGLRHDAQGKTLWVSKIFQWAAKDFVPKGALNAETLLPAIEAYLDPALAAAIKARPLRLKFLDYDASLNAR
jgi:ABC-type nickel/cobalt efflux system permease component RcnA